MRFENDILDLLHKGMRVHFKRAALVAPMNFSFGRVNGGRPITSETLLFRLPVELVQEVVMYLDTADLKSLALVDRDCRQLARSCLFASVVLDYSSEKWQLLEELNREGRGRQNSGGISKGPSIGACIRHLMVRTNPDALARRHEVTQYRFNRRVPREKQEEIIGSYYGTYIPAIAQALTHSLPNLDTLVWEEQSGMIPRQVFKAIAGSQIRHFRLSYATLGSDCRFRVLQLMPRQGWPLRALDYWPKSDYINPLDYTKDFSRVARYTRGIFEEVAPTLEQLSCDSRVFPEDCVIRFPRLRALWLNTEAEVPGSVIESFFPADAMSCALHSVAISSPNNVGIWKSLARRGHIRGLEVLQLHPINPEYEIPVTAFLSANPHLKSLLMYTYKYGFLPTTTLSFLGPNFRFLTSLVITLWSPAIPPSILATVGRISSLNSLWIAAGGCYSTRKWIINNPPVIAALSPLRNLTHLALTEGLSATTSPNSRRSQFPLANYRSATDPKSQQSWEGWHSERVRKVVIKYVGVVKSLKWVYIGQLVHTVVGDEIVLEGGGMRVLFPQGAWGVSM